MKQLFAFGTSRGGTTFFARMMSLNQQVEMASDPFLPVYRQFRNHAMKNISELEFDISQPLSDHYFDDISIVEKNAVASFEVDNLIGVNELKRLISELKDRMELASKELVSHLDNIDISSGISYKDLFYKLQDILKMAYSCDNGYIGALDNWVIEFLPLLLKVFPDAKFIIIVRDPRAAVASSLGLGNKNPELVPSMYSFARHVRKHMAYAINFTNNPTYSDKIKIIKYEELASSPRDTLLSVCNFLDIEYSSIMLNTGKFRPISGKKWSKHSSFENVPEKGVYTQSIDRWKERLSSDIIEFVELICGPEMGYFGYKTTLFNRLNISPKVFDFALLDSQSPFEWRNEYTSIYSEISKDFFRYQLINLRGREIDPSVLERNFISSSVFDRLK